MVYEGCFSYYTAKHIILDTIESELNGKRPEIHFDTNKRFNDMEEAEEYLKDKTNEAVLFTGEDLWSGKEELKWLIRYKV